MFCCVAFLNFSLQTRRKNMIVEYYFDRIEAAEFLRRDVCEEVALAPTVPREEYSSYGPSCESMESNQPMEPQCSHECCHEGLSLRQGSWMLSHLHDFFSSTTGWIGRLASSRLAKWICLTSTPGWIGNCRPSWRLANCFIFNLRLNRNNLQAKFKACTGVD